MSDESPPAAPKAKKPKKPKVHAKKAKTPSLYKTGQGPPKTRELWERMVTLYRGNPAKHTLVAREVGASRNWCERTYNEGWPGLRWAESIRKALEKEARRTPVRDKAEQDRIEREERQAEIERVRYEKAVAREQALLDQATRSVTATVLVVQGMTSSVTQILKRIAELTKDGAQGVSLKDCLRAMTAYANASTKAVLAADAIVKLSRLDRGLATGVVRVNRDGHEDSVDHAIEQLGEAAEIFERYQKRGLLLGEGERDEEDEEDGSNVVEGGSSLPVQTDGTSKTDQSGPPVH